MPCTRNLNIYIYQILPPIVKVMREKSLFHVDIVQDNWLQHKLILLLAMNGMAFV